MDGLLMWRALLIAVLIALLATVASADIRRLMQAKGYGTSIGSGCLDGCSVGAMASTASENQPPPASSGCALPAALPCQL